MLLTLARTAAVACLLGVLIAFAARTFKGRHQANQASGARILVVLVAGVFAIGAFGLATGKVGEAVNGFVLKRQNADVSKSFYDSRGWGIVSQWHNFLNRPFAGNGFGVYANGKFPAGVVEVYGIPLSAPVEKGFAPTAVLEETGVLGTLAFIWMFWVLAREAHRNIDLRLIATFWAALLVNLGEAVILSPGGIGLYVWLLISMSAASGSTPTDDTDVSDIPTADPVPLTPLNLMR
jgi:hypothetical protein